MFRSLSPSKSRRVKCYGLSARGNPVCGCWSLRVGVCHFGKIEGFLFRLCGKSAHCVIVCGGPEERGVGLDAAGEAEGEPIPELLSWANAGVDILCDSPLSRTKIPGITSERRPPRLTQKGESKTS